MGVPVHRGAGRGDLQAPPRGTQEAGPPCRQARRRQEAPRSLEVVSAWTRRALNAEVPEFANTYPWRAGSGGGDRVSQGQTALCCCCETLLWRSASAVSEHAALESGKPPPRTSTLPWRTGSAVDVAGSTGSDPGSHCRWACGTGGGRPLRCG